MGILVRLTCSMYRHCLVNDMKDMFGNAINVGDTVIFHDTGSYRRFGCSPIFLVGEWKVTDIEYDSIRVQHGHLPNDSYYYWFPLNATEVVNYDEIPSEMVGNILL